MATLATTSPRQHRLLPTLARRSVTRLDAVRIALAPNGPHYVGLLRRAFGLALPSYGVPCVPVDGDPCKSGVYVPTVADRRKITRILTACNTQLCRMILANSFSLRSFLAENHSTWADVADFLNIPLGTVRNWHSTAYPQTVLSYRREPLEPKIEKAEREASNE